VLKDWHPQVLHFPEKKKGLLCGTNKITLYVPLLNSDYTKINVGIQKNYLYPLLGYRSS
jgi:hypothetical protein